MPKKAPPKKKKTSSGFSLGKFLYYMFLVFLGFLIAVAYRQMLKPSPDNPVSFVEQNHHRPGRQVVVCAGDSLTRGQLSFDFCGYLNLQADLQNYQFINDGINGDLSYNLLQRLEPIIACKPNYIVLLIGTTDLLNSLYPKSAKYVQWVKQLPQSGSLVWYSGNLELMIQILQQRTRAKIAVLSLPTVGEAVSSAADQKVREYNEVIESIAARKKVRYLPLYERQMEYLRKNQLPPGPKFTGNLKQMFFAGFNHLVFKQSLDLIADRNNYLLHSDGVHLNSWGGKMIAEQIKTFLKAK
ncbi:MAG TPA: SGNH/GDSL hydrolase family protein [Bacillota bacterium]|nr:SGNH/GDSL hydrolase family protein [Bacillota bacterium]